MNSNLLGHRSIAAAIVVISVCTWVASTMAAHADVSASTTPSLPGMSALPGIGALPDVNDIFGTTRRLTGLTATIGASTSESSTVPGIGIPAVTIPDVTGIFNGASTTASSTGSGLGSAIADAILGAIGSTGTSGMGAAIADSITGGANGTSNIGPFIKCGLIAPIGWPLPTFSTECNASTTNKARLTIVKNTVGGNGSFDFLISGSGDASTTITTSGGTASVQFLGNPGTYIVAELARDGWSQSSRVCVDQHATSTGSASGALGWSVLLTAGDDIVCTFVNTAASTTPGGGGGCTENCGGGGGGCVTDCGGGGTPGGGTSGSGGGGGGGGGSGPVLGGGGFSPGEVLGNSISLPGIPNTGVGGNAESIIFYLLSSLVVALSGIALLRKME